MIYFDNSATTYPKPECVYEALDYANRNLAFNAGRGHYEQANKASLILDSARESIASFVGASKNDIAFTSSATEALNLIILGLNLENNNYVYVSPFEHNSIIRPLYKLSKERNIHIVELPFSHDNWEPNLNKIEEMFTINKPKAVFISHLSNVTGLLIDYISIFDIAKKYQSITVLDAAQSFGIISPELKNVDFATAIRELSNENFVYVYDRKADTQAEPDFTDKIHKACCNFIGSPAEIYINKRGISTQIAQKFMLGYSESEHFPDRQKHPALIIPISKSLYICRNIEQGERFSNSKGDKKAIFNIDCLNQNTPTFICESAIDALSIIEVGSQAIALNSVSNHEFLTKELSKLQQIPPFIICLDNDEAGTKTTKSLSVAFANMQIKSIDGRFILNDCKDINEALLKDKSAFIEAISVAKNKVLDIKLHIKQKHKPFFKIQNLSNELEALNYSVKHNLITK